VLEAIGKGLRREFIDARTTFKAKRTKKAWKMTRVEPSAKYQPLMNTESSLMFFLAEPAITTISFFKGDVDIDKSKAWLKDRLTSIARANPWLGKRV